MCCNGVCKEIEERDCVVEGLSAESEELVRNCPLANFVVLDSDVGSATEANFVVIVATIARALPGRAQPRDCHNRTVFTCGQLDSIGIVLLL